MKMILIAVASLLAACSPPPSVGTSVGTVLTQSAVVQVSTVITPSLVEPKVATKLHYDDSCPNVKGCPEIIQAYYAKRTRLGR